MKLHCETILDFYSNKNKRILCQIKVASRKSRTFKKTCRCLTQVEWNAFDKELERLITSTDDWNDEKCLKFNIKPDIEVKVQKSKLSLKHFYKCLGAIDDDSENDFDREIETNYVLECLFDFKEEAFLESQEYEPQIETTPDKLHSPLSYEPYTPSKKKYRADNILTVKTPGTDFLDCNIDTYSPKYIYEITASETQLTQTIPKYTPAPIRETRSSSESNKSSQRDLIIDTHSSRGSNKSSRQELLDEVIVETGDEIDSPEIFKSSGSKLNKKSKKREIEYIPKSQEYAVDNVPVYIPTPIEKNTQRKVIKPDYDIRKHKKRSMTIDELPAPLLEDNENEHVDSKNKHIRRCDNKKFKQRSKTIDEAPAGFAVNIEQLKSKNWPEESKEKPGKNKESTSLKSKEKKHDLNANVSSAKDKATTQSENKPIRKVSAFPSSEDDILSAIKKSKKTSKTLAKKSDDEFEDSNKNTKSPQTEDNPHNLNISISSATGSTTDTSPQKAKRRGRKEKENSTDGNKPTNLRRSERSPSKPIRYREQQHELLQSNKSKKSKTSPKNKELFGTDDDEDEDELFENNNGTKSKIDNKVKSSSVFQTPVSKKSDKSASSSSSSSTKKKRKRDKSSECEQEKRNMSIWLSKKQSSSDKDTKQTSAEKSSSSKVRPLKTSKKEKCQKNEAVAESRPKSVSPTPSIELLSKEELELMRNKSKLMQKENAKVRAELDKMRTSPPKEVEILSLENVSEEDILNTFSIYKSELDEIYENNRKRDYIKGHEGINHCFVIRLLQPNIQMKMLEKLTDVYSNTNNSAQATLFANALLPEWLIRVYMEKFNFTRLQAIDQIKAQEEFRLHKEEQSDNSFVFD